MSAVAKPTRISFPLNFFVHVGAEIPRAHFLCPGVYISEILGIFFLFVGDFFHTQFGEFHHFS